MNFTHSALWHPNIINQDLLKGVRARRLTPLPCTGERASEHKSDILRLVDFLRRYRAAPGSRFMGHNSSPAQVSETRLLRTERSVRSDTPKGRGGRGFS